MPRPVAAAPRCLPFAAALLLALASVGLISEPAAAQDPCIYGCIDPDPDVDVPPWMTISPQDGEYDSNLSVTVEWCDDNDLDDASRSIRLNGTYITSSFSYGTGSQDCGDPKISSGTVNLNTGDNTLITSICDNADQCRADTASYVYNSYTVAVTPDGTDVTVEAGGSETVTYTVKNNGTASATYDFTQSCSGTVSGCSLSKSSATLSAGQSTTVNQSFSVGGGGTTGEARLTATHSGMSGATNDGWFNATVVDYEQPPVVSLAPHNGDYLDVAKCLLDCFDGSVAYTTPAYISRDEPRSLTLIYRSGQAAPRGYVQVDVSKESGTNTPEKTSIRLKRNGSWVTFTNGNQEIFWQGSSGTRRLAVQFDASGLGTGAHEHTLVARHWWNGTFKETTDTVRVLVVDEQDSPYGAGWSVAGLQRLHFQSDGIVVTEGDGSAAYFADNGSGWTNPPGDFTTLTELGNGTYERRYPDGTTLTFSSAGRLTEAADRFGQSTSYSYSSGKLTSMVDPAGDTITLAYGGDGKLAWIEDPAGRRSTVTINAAGEVTKITDPGGLDALVATYDGDHRMRHRTDRRGGGWGFRYDFAGKLHQDSMPQVVADGVSTRPVVTFRSLERRVLVDPGSGAGTSSNPATSVAPGGAEPWVKNPRGETTHFEVDRFYAPTQIREPLGRTTDFVRNGDSQVTRVTAPSGHQTDFTWSGPDLKKTVDQATGRTVQVDYESTYHQPIEVYGDADSVFATYDTSGRLETLRRGSSSVPATTYHYSGTESRPDSVVDPEGHTTAFHYATTGHRNTDSVVAEGGRTSAFDYDAHGRTVTVTDPVGAETHTAYDSLNRVVRTIGPVGDTTHYSRGELYLDGVTDAEGQTWSYEVNALGWVTKRTDPTGAFETYAYDENGNLKTWTNRLGEVVSFTYDALDQLTGRTAGGVTTTYATDPDGLWTMVDNGASVDTVEYDVAGRPIRQITVRGGTRYTLEASFDKQNRRTALEMLEPDTRQVDYGYNDHSGLDTLVDLSGGVTTLGYNADRQATAIRYPTGDTLFRDPTSSHRFGAFTWSDSTLHAAAGKAYTLDTLSRVATQIVSGEPVRMFDYDPASRLTGYDDVIFGAPQCSWDEDHGFQCTPSSVDTVQSVSYSYDRVGNRTDSGAQVATGNRLTAFDGWTLEWDAAGQLTRQYNGATDRRFYWNALGQLDSVSVDGVVTRFTYDGFGRRIEKQGPAGTVEQVYDGDDPFWELDGSGAVQAEYSFYPGVDRPHSVERGGSTYYYAQDELGSVMALFDGSGNVVNQYRYDPWGQAESASEGVPNPFRFTGREFDAETGLQYHRARYYDPGLGRFIAEDPIGLAGGINPYAYTLNSPTNAVDPFGLDPCDTEAANADKGEACTVPGVTVNHRSRSLLSFLTSAQSAAWLPGHATIGSTTGPANSGNFGASNGGETKSPDPDKVAGEDEELCDELRNAQTWAIGGSVISYVSLGTFVYKAGKHGAYELGLRKLATGVFGAAVQYARGKGWLPSNEVLRRVPPDARDLLPFGRALRLESEMQDLTCQRPNHGPTPVYIP